MPMPRKNGSASATLVPVAYRLLANSTTWMTTGATHAPASSAATPPIVKASVKVPRLAPAPTVPAKREKSISNDVEHRQGEGDEEHRDAEVEPRRGVDGAEGAGGEHDDQAEHAVDERHRAAVGQARGGTRAAASRPARRRR